MDIIFAVSLVLLVLAFLGALLWGLFKTVEHDGLGHRPPPPSHYYPREAFPFR
jgi:hypothetical protein